MRADVRRIPQPGGDDLVVTWRSPAGAPVGLALLVALGALLARHPPRDAWLWLAMAPALLFLGYVALALCVNRTRLTLHGHTIAIEHGPLPWPGRQRLDLGGTTELRVRLHKAYRGVRDHELCARAGPHGPPIPILRGPRGHLELLQRELATGLGLAHR